MKNTLSLTVAAFALVVVGCGSKSSKKAFPLEAADLQAELAAQSTSDAVSAAAAGDGNGSTGISLSLAGETSPYKTMTRVCEVQADGSAKVTITSQMGFENQTSTARMSRTNKMSGTSEETRLWSNGGTVACSADGQHAAINWNTDLSGVSLKVHVNRTRSHVITQTNLVKNVTVSRTRSFTAEGERDVSFVSHSNDGTNLTIVKNVSGESQRSFTFIDKNGQEQSGSLASVGQVQIKVIRLVADNSLVSREIVSGSRTSTSGDGSKIETTYANFILSGEGESCQAQSGSLTLKYSDSAGSLSKTVTCSAELGALSCSDADGNSVTLESPSCDPIDAK